VKDENSVLRQVAQRACWLERWLAASTDQTMVARWALSMAALRAAQTGELLVVSMVDK
jgi:hypothetical protein